MNITRQSGNFQFERDPSCKNVEAISKIHQKLLLLMKFLETKPEVRNMKNIYFDLYYTVIKNRNDE